MKTEHGLTQQQEAFARAIVEGKSGDAAYAKAYPKSRAWKPSARKVAASKMLAIPNVSERIKVLHAKAAERAILKASEVLMTFRRVHMADPGKLMRRDKGSDGNERAVFLLPDELDEDTRAAIASVKIDDMGRVEYRFWPKVEATKEAARILGLYEKDNEQLANPLAQLMRTLTGNVARPDPAAAAPDPELRRTLGNGAPDEDED